MSNDSREETRYVEVSGRLNHIHFIGAWAIFALMLVATWGQWRHFAAVLVVQVALVPFNVWVTLSLLPRRGLKTGELIRTAVNLTGTIVLGALTNWPLPVWLWLPYVALAYDHLGVRTARLILLSMCCVASIGGLVSGVHWLYPLTFVALAVICSEISRVRFQVIRDMLMTSDTQRADLETAHAELRSAHEELTHETLAREQVEIELRHAQKLEAVGHLAAGIAHEINTPVQFVSDGVHFLRDGNAALLALAERHREAFRKVLAGGSLRECGEALARAEQELDMAYFVTELPQAAERSLEGLDRIAVIVRSMKEFAQPDQKEARPVDLNSAISSTLTIARSEYKYVANVELDLGPIPLVTCHAGEINQVILILLVNAAHAIADKYHGAQQLGTIAVRTVHEGGQVVIAMADSGSGIALEHRERIFEPFFTTKEVGRGTGQGLAVARSIVLRHGGTLTFTSEVGLGTTFTIRLPVDTQDVAVLSAPRAA